MNVLNVICYGCALLFSCILFIAVFSTFVYAVYMCFKKDEHKFVYKLLIAITIGCACPWLLKLCLTLFSLCIGV